MKNHSRFKVAKIILVIWCLFIGIGAVGGASCMLIDPSGKLMGMDTLLPYFQVLPFADVLFQNYIFPGFALLVVNGISNLTAAFLLFRNKKSGVILGGVFGITLMLWITIQFIIFPKNFLDIAYFIFGLLQAITGFAAFVFYSQEHFLFEKRNYPDVGTNPERLVVYFSRLGYTKKIAYEEAELSGAYIYEVKATEKTEGTLGFWWCGRFGMHRWDMPIEQVGIDLTKFEHITICTPMWVYNICAPMRSFCRAANGKIKSADYIIVHFQRALYKNAVEEMDSLLGIHGKSLKSICSRWGRVIKLQKLELSEKEKV